MALPAQSIAFVPVLSLPDPRRQSPRPSLKGAAPKSDGAFLWLPALSLAAVAGRVASQRRQRVRAIPRAYSTGPGWTDEIARIFDPRWEGPEWIPNLGYRGRKSLRVMLDAEDICMSYAKAKWKQTGRWTGPLSEGIDKALSFGGWGGGVPENVERPEEAADKEWLQFEPPEMLTFVALPADLIEEHDPELLIDGYPQELREQLGNVGQVDYDEFLQKGVYSNEWLRSLQDENRLFTWKRDARHPSGTLRENTLMLQKNYREGLWQYVSSKTMPVMLGHTIGAGVLTKVGSPIEVLKPGKFVNGNWLPSKWTRGKVKAINYDGTYDIQLEHNHGPWRIRRSVNEPLNQKNAKNIVSSQRKEMYMGNGQTWGADKMAAEFRLDFDKEFMQGIPASSLRLPNMQERLGDTLDLEAGQDWYLCTTKNYEVKKRQLVKEEEKNMYWAQGLLQNRLARWKSQFLVNYRWVKSAEGLSFEPIPNDQMEKALLVNHKETAGKLNISAEADIVDRVMLAKLKEDMDNIERELEVIQPVPEVVPTRPAGPREEYLRETPRKNAREQQATEPVPYPLPAPEPGNF